MSSRLPQRFNTIRTLDCTESGFREIRGYPCCNNNRGKRTKHYRKTLPAMMKANEKRSFNTCFMEALNNFDRNDYCITCTFGKAISDANRVKLVKNMLTRLRRFYNKIGAVLRYQLFWGRGDENEELHVHILVNRIDGITFEELLKVLRDRLNKIDVHLQRIGEKWNHSTPDYIIIIVTVIYLYQHWGTLTEADRKITTMNNDRWRPSRTLNKVEVTEEYDDDETEQPVEKSPYKQLNMLWNAWQKGKEDFNDMIAKIYVGYRVMGYGYDRGKCPFYIDDYGNVFFKVELAKIGSRVDCGHRTTTQKVKQGDVEYLYVIDTITGEVVKEYSSELATA